MARRKGSFEGWYLKHQKEGRCICLIPAVHVDSYGWVTASIQVITENRSSLFTFPEEAFQMRSNDPCVKIGRNLFCRHGISVALANDEISVRGKLFYGPLITPERDIMGPFRLLPKMQCSHGVVSLGHELRGTLRINGESVCFDRGTGYVETDRGRSFPPTYLWTQCNLTHWPVSCVMTAIAEIPYMSLNFLGCICSVYYKGREYRLATYNGVRILAYSKGEVHLRQGKLDLHIWRLDERAHPLLAPKHGSMRRFIHESPACKVRYRFMIGERVLFDHISTHASYEYSNEKENRMKEKNAMNQEESSDNKYNISSETLQAASMMDCTGLIPSEPQSEEELEAYKDIMEFMPGDKSVH